MFFLYFLLDSQKKKTKKKNQNGPDILQEYLATLAAGKLGNETKEYHEHKLVNAKNKEVYRKLQAKF